jgi:single-stranded DNA-specific DHH superfamily exonuclease
MNFQNIMSKEDMFFKLDNIINKLDIKDKILIITHNDLDGLVSAYCLEKYLISGNFNVVVHTLSNKILMQNFDDYCDRINTDHFDCIISLDIFDQKMLTQFNNKKYFVVDHHASSKNLDKDNIVNLSDYFNINKIPAVGAFLFGYTQNKVEYPVWFSLVAKFCDGLILENEFFVSHLDNDINYINDLPRPEILKFIEFINSFYNHDLNIKDIYLPFRECVDSDNLFWYGFSKSEELIYLNKLKKKIDISKDALLKKCLIKYKKYDSAKLILFNITEKENEVRREIIGTFEYLFFGYNILFLSKTNDGYIISYRTNTTNFDVIKNLKPIYDNYCHFQGHPFAAGGFVKTEFKNKFIKDTLNYLKKYYLNKDI